MKINFGFFTRIISVFEYVTFDIGPDPDQIVGGYIFMDMWQGKFPYLGGAGAGGRYGFAVPPLYAYLVLKLFPLPIQFKRKLILSSKTFKIGNLPLYLPAGNLAFIGYKQS